MDHGPYSRRAFLAAAGGAAGTAWLAAATPAIAAAAEQAQRVASGGEPESFQLFTVEQARLVEAVTARIVPSEGPGPGAREARVTVFIDRVLVNPFSAQQRDFIEGLHTFADDFAKLHGTPFTTANPTLQDAFLATREHSPFFGLLQALTGMGMFSSPSYGGNANEQGWALIGFEDTHAFAPPFGFYDSNYPGFEAVAARYRKRRGR